MNNFKAKLRLLFFEQIYRKLQRIGEKFRKKNLSKVLFIFYSKILYHSIQWIWCCILEARNTKKNYYTVRSSIHKSSVKKNSKSKPRGSEIRNSSSSDRTSAYKDETSSHKSSSSLSSKKVWFIVFSKLESLMLER